MKKQQQKFVIWVLATVMLVNCVGTNLIYSLYVVDQDLFVELFCENKANPDLNCDGSCMLMKMATHDHHHDQPTLLDVYKVQLVFYVPAIHSASTLTFEAVTHQFFYQNHYSFQGIDHPFHPPILA